MSEHFWNTCYARGERLAAEILEDEGGPAGGLGASAASSALLGATIARLRLCGFTDAHIAEVLQKNERHARDVAAEILKRVRM